MAEDLAALLARVRAAVPGLADVPDAALAQALAADAGPSVADALSVPTFRTSNEKDPSGAAVVRDSGPGPTVGEALAPASTKPPLGFLAPYLERGMDLLRGATGLGDQGPAGPTWTNAGQVLAAVAPFVPGKLTSLKEMANALAMRERAAAAGPLVSETRPQLSAVVGHGDALLSRFGSTARPEATSFILHDGTRIRGGGATTHADLANAIGLHVDDLQTSGIVRNVHEQGIEVATPITEAQARIAVDDAKVGGYPLNVDVMVPGGLQSKVFTRPSVDGVRNWIKAALK